MSDSDTVLAFQHTDWATVPQTYKGYDSQHPDPARSTASIFTFRW